jgi:tetratricopeptide (TPR) repeat protein
VPAKELKDKLVLVISAEGTHRENLGKALRTDGYQTNFVGNLTTVMDLLDDFRPGTLMHDWAAVQPSQATVFQQKLGKITDYSAMCRIIYAETITPALLALAVDCGIRRVLSYSASTLNLVNEIKMAASGMKGLSEIQHIVQSVANGDAKYSQKEIDDTVERAHQQFNHDPVVRLEYGNLCYRRGATAEASQIAAGLIGEQPTNVRAMNLLARTLMKEGQLDDAVKCLEKANGLSPFNTERLCMLGDAFFKSGNNAKAAEAYGQAQALDPSNPDASKGLGLVRLSEGDVNAALDLLKNSASEEEAASFFNNAAIHAAKQGKLEESLRLYETALKALRTDKLKPIVYFNIALAYEKLGRTDDALKHIKRVLKYVPTHEKALRAEKRLTAGATKRPA